MSNSKLNHRKKSSTKYKSEYIPLDCEAMMNELRSGRYKDEILIQDNSIPVSRKK